MLAGRDASRWHELLPAASIQPRGFADGEAMLPVTLRSFQDADCSRSISRFRSGSDSSNCPACAGSCHASTPLSSSWSFCSAAAIRISRSSSTRRTWPCFAPAINLFPRRAIAFTSPTVPIVPRGADRTRPVDFEVYQITEVLGHGVGAGSEQEFVRSTQPTAPTRSTSTPPISRLAASRVSSPRNRSGAACSSYIGSEVFLGLVDAAHAPFSGDLRQLSIQTLCTNRDLVLQMPVGIGRSDFTLDVAAPVTAIRGLPVRVVRSHRPPTGPCRRAISHLSLNYLSLVNVSEQEGAGALRDLLERTPGQRRQREKADRQHPFGPRQPCGGVWRK